MTFGSALFLREIDYYLAELGPGQGLLKVTAQNRLRRASNATLWSNHKDSLYWLLYHFWFMVGVLVVELVTAKVKIIFCLKKIYNRNSRLQYV